MADKGTLLGMSRQFMIENRAALVANGTFTIDEIVQMTTPNNAATQAQITTQVAGEVAAINAAIAAGQV